MNMGQLVPICCQEILPGDSFRWRTEMLIRFAPMLAPVMHRVNAKTEFFFVPNRLVWDEWELFITGGKTGQPSPAPMVPQIAIPQNVEGMTLEQLCGLGSLVDYMGLPVTSEPTNWHPQSISLLPFRAYQLIYNEYYRDQNLSDPVGITKRSGLIADAAEIIATMSMRNRSWEKDYFTSALPNAQRGGSVGVPGVTALQQAVVRDSAGNPQDAGPLATNALGGLTGGAGASPTFIDQTISTMIQDLRKANALQRFLEKMNLSGARYVEQLRAMFGVSSSDQRLQRPEFLGSGRSPVVVSEVLSNFQFSGDPEGLPQGNMAGHGISVGSDHGFSRTFEEHGYVIGLLSVVPKTAYQQGLPRHFQRFDKFDYAWPDFAHLGEQEVKSKELYWQMGGGSAGPDEETFGYQSRYAEYKFGLSSVHGDFRENLAYWTMGRIFDSAPVLNEQFVTADPTTRIFAVTEPTLHHLYCQVYNDVSALRPLPYYGTPNL